MPGGGYEPVFVEHPSSSAYNPGPTMHYGPIEPQGELVNVWTLANPNYRLAAREGGAVLAFKNSRDVKQHWTKVDVGPKKGEFVDREGQPGFILVSKATGLPLQHGFKADDIVITQKELYGPNSMDGTLIWSLGAKDEGHGYKGMRAVTNISLNLHAQHADIAHGGVRDGNKLVLSYWIPQENMKWKIEPVESVGQEA